MVELGDALTEGCGGGGYYRADPATIYLHPAMWRRDDFTLLHELGHHIQQHHPQWAFTLLDLPALVRRMTEEAVSRSDRDRDPFPGQGPARRVQRAPGVVMAAMYRSSSATRSAVLQRVEEAFCP